VVYSGTGTRLLPAFSIFSGTAVASAHDGATVTKNFLTTTFGTSAGFGLDGSGKVGAFNALGNWSIGNDSGALSSLTYVGNVADGTSTNYGSAAGILGDGLADGFASGTFDLGPGTYSIFIGGANYGAGSTGYGVDPGPFTNFGYSASLTVAPVPEPSTWALAAIGVAGAAAWRGRRRRASRATNA
jgi:MYXO-CTERM domain-containing protein